MYHIAITSERCSCCWGYVKDKDESYLKFKTKAQAEAWVAVQKEDNYLVVRG